MEEQDFAVDPAQVQVDIGVMAHLARVAAADLEEEHIGLGLVDEVMAVFLAGREARAMPGPSTCSPASVISVASPSRM